jgi:hypothetical protein
VRNDSPKQGLEGGLIEERGLENEVLGDYSIRFEESQVVERLLLSSGLELGHMFDKSGTVSMTSRS